MYLLCGEDGFSMGPGELLTLGCAVAFGVQINCIDYFAPQVDGFRLNCIQALTVAVISLPFVILTETVNTANILACWGPLCFAGMLSMGLAYSMQIVGQTELDAAPAALIMSLESVFAALGGWWLLNEQMTGTELLGCGLVFAAVILSQLPEKKEAP